MGNNIWGAGNRTCMLLGHTPWTTYQGMVRHPGRLQDWGKNRTGSWSEEKLKAHSPSMSLRYMDLTSCPTKNLEFLLSGVKQSSSIMPSLRYLGLLWQQSGRQICGERNETTSEPGFPGVWWGTDEAWVASSVRGHHLHQGWGISSLRAMHGSDKATTGRIQHAITP